MFKLAYLRMSINMSHLMLNHCSLIFPLKRQLTSSSHKYAMAIVLVWPFYDHTIGMSILWPHYYGQQHIWTTKR